MTELKTQPNSASVAKFIESLPDKQRQQDSEVLLKLFKTVTGLKPTMWGTSIVGFDLYHYKSERSSQAGDWPLIAFSPRKQNLTLYIMFDFAECASLLAKLGKHKTSKACLYINKLSDVDMAVLEQLLKKSYIAAKKKLK